MDSYHQTKLTEVVLGVDECLLEATALGSFQN